MSVIIFILHNGTFFACVLMNNKYNKLFLNKKTMFGKRKNFNDLFNMFNDMDSMFNQPFFIKGKTNSDNGTDENGDWHSESFISDDGTYSVTSIVRSYSSGGTTPKSTDKSSTNEINSLKRVLKRCVEDQNYEKAAELRDQIQKLEQNQDKINELETKLDNAVKEQDFEQAIKLRDQINKLKG